jgi:LPS-assembly lipoprotein
MRIRPYRWLSKAGAASFCAVFALALAGCGFQLRGAADLPFQSIYLGVSEGSTLGAELRRNLRGATQTAVVSDPKQAQARLELTEAREREVRTVNAKGEPQEYELRYRAVFRVHDGKGTDFIPSTEILLKRDISFNQTQVIAKQNEEALLYRDMQSDLVQQLLRRLAAAKPQPQ